MIVELSDVAGQAVNHHAGCITHRRGDHWEASSHGLQNGVGEALVFRGHQQDITPAEECWHIIPASEELHHLGQEAESKRKSLQRSPLGSVAYNERPQSRDPRLQQPYHTKEVVYTLYRIESAYAQERGRVV